jgi:hypothetical protein
VNWRTLYALLPMSASVLNRILRPLGLGLRA